MELTTAADVSAPVFKFNPESQADTIYVGPGLCQSVAHPFLRALSQLRLDRDAQPQKPGSPIFSAKGHVVEARLRNQVTDLCC